MPNTAAPCWRARLRKLAWLLPALSLTACSAPPAVIPRIPEPAADLMKPAPTGSEVCYAEYGDLATDAAEWADQVNGLQGYIRGVRGAMP